MALNGLIHKLEAASDKIFNPKIFTHNVKSILLISAVALLTAFLVTAYTFLGIILMFIGIGLIMLAVEFICLFIVIVVLVIALFKKKSNKHIEVGLLIGIGLGILYILHLFKFISL